MIKYWLALFIALLSVASAYAEERGGEDEEYNFSWLDPDKKIYVLQNRKYHKAGRFGLFISGGLNVSNPFKTEYVGTGRAAYWFTEQFGVEAMYSGVLNYDNTTMTDLRNVNSTALPFVRENLYYYAGLLTWTPWYAKLNFFNKILYLDWFVNAGVGQVATALDLNRNAFNPPNLTYQTYTALFFGTGQNFFLTNNFLIRLDLIGLVYQAVGADNVTTHTYTNLDFSAGVGLTL